MEKMNSKPILHKNSRTAKTIHRHTIRLVAGGCIQNASASMMFIIVTTVIALALPLLVKCDTNIFNEIDDGDETQHAKNTLTELSGGKIIGEKWLRQLESPYTLQTDLTIERTGKLFVEPGVTVHVAPMVGITVRGVITALVSIFNLRTKIRTNRETTEMAMKKVIRHVSCLIHSGLFFLFAQLQS